ncbi:cation:proton antiporter [candidate division WOR-3 bacterium]|uniref:Cation:proton antiporter n=1 Tax=candidate division WOR-3 bacterium TaxID=2052148 RepID=A0A9D5K8G0_UNCW3|nr:cation:proton antiporter [candidate division WOR-3 bacterium]MBD3364238.1 cation:proton antiporter [candidate division WOR-3 bacterium]
MSGLNILIIVIIAVLAIAAVLCLYRIFRGPTIADRMVGVDIMGILFVGITALTGIVYKLSFLLDVAIVLALISFVASIALAKYLERRTLDD